MFTFNKNNRGCAEATAEDERKSNLIQTAGIAILLSVGLTAALSAPISALATEGADKAPKPEQHETEQVEMPAGECPSDFAETG